MRRTVEHRLGKALLGVLAAAALCSLGALVLADPLATPLNNASSVLAQPHLAGSGSLVLRTGDGVLFGSPTPSAPIRVTVASRATLANGGIGAQTLQTIYLVTGRTSDTLTGLTAIEGTSDRNYVANDLVGALVTAGTIADIHSALTINGASLASKANDSAVVHLSGAETITGTKVIPVQDRGGLVWHAKAFGAVGDGVTDDTDEINAAITAAQTAGGGVVKLPPGSFYTKGHQLPSNVHLEGSGHSYTKLLIRGDTNLSAGVELVGVDHASVRDLTIDVRTNSPNCDGVAFMVLGAVDGTGTPCTNCTVEGCEILGFDSHQYLIWNQLGEHIKIAGNWVEGNVTVRNPASGLEGIEIQGGVDVWIAGNTVRNVGNNGIFVWTVDAATNMVCDDVRVIGNSVNGANVGIGVGSQKGASGTNTTSRVKVLANVVQNCLEYGCQVWTSDGAPVVDVDISHNTFDSIGALTRAGVYGFFAEGDVTWAANPTLCRDVRVTDNLFRGIIGSGTSAGANIANWPGLIFARNTVKDVTSGTVAGIACGNSPDVRIIDNVVDNSNTIGIDVQSGSDRTKVVGNNVRSWNAANTNNGGITLGSVSYCQVLGNSFYQPSGGHDYFPVAPQASCSFLAIAANVASYATSYDLNPIVGTSPGSNVAAGTQLYWDKANSRLGVGTTTPAAQAAIVPSTDATTGLILKGHSATQSGHLLSAQDNNGNELASIDKSGNLVAFTIKSPSASITGQSLIATGGNAQVEIDSRDGLGGEFVLYSPDAGSLRVYANGDKLTLGSTGNLTLAGNVQAGAGKALQVGTNSVTFAAAQPTTGTWVAGDVAWNSAVASGQPEGWRCTASGTPGTWSPMGNHP